MANFVTVVDPIENRRRAYLKKIEHLLPPVGGLKIQSCSSGDFSAIWAAGTWTKVDCLVDDEGVTLVFGDAIARPDSRRLDANHLRELWNKPDWAAPLDGFHVAATYDSKGALVIGADLLGVFPVYYYTSEDIFLVGTSPELFRYHSSFRTKLDPEGLVGILLTKGLVDGKTLLSGVRRLAAGNLLKRNSEGELVEVAQYKLPMSTRYFNMSLSQQVEILDEALEEAVARHVPRDKNCCLMLSGGLDSTLLAGYLERAGYDILTITEGLSTDNEMKCAKKVAEALGYEHIQFLADHENYAQYSDLSTTWQHCSEGFTGVSFWGFYKQLRKTAPYVITGFAGDGILGTMVDWSRRGFEHSASFETLFKTINAQAFNPRLLKKLLKKEYYDAFISETLKRIKEMHDGYPGLEFQKTWGFGLNQRIRFHDLSGIWPLSFGAWPILPFADHKVLETAGGFPIESLANRRVERELLRTKFPKLARLALAGSTLNAASIVLDSRSNAQQQIFGTKGIWKLRILREVRDQLLARTRGERRYWPRVSHFDSPGWKIIRKTAEPYVPLTTRFLRKESVDELIPSADSSYLQVRRKMKQFGVSETSSLRIVLGLAIWSKDHLDAITNARTDCQ